MRLLKKVFHGLGMGILGSTLIYWLFGFYRIITQGKFIVVEPNLFVAFYPLF
jgi:hypothetical protein